MAETCADSTRCLEDLSSALLGPPPVGPMVRGRAERCDAVGCRHARRRSIRSRSRSILERGAHDPTTEVLARISAALGMDLSVRLFPGTGPLIRDHIQSSMVSMLVSMLADRWRPSLEVAVYKPVRGVIDVVLESEEPPLVACESQSELRRLEQHIRWSQAKAAALSEARGTSVARLLLLRSTTRTRAIVSEHAALIAVAFPGRHAAAMAALTSDAPWPGDSIVWCTVAAGATTLLPSPPSGIPIGR